PSRAVVPAGKKSLLREVQNSPTQSGQLFSASLGAPLDLKSGTTLKGAGIGKTIVTQAPGWKADTSTLPDPETNRAKFDRSGYLIRLEDKAVDITVSDLTLTGPQVHGAIFGSGNENVHLHDLRIADFMFSGIRSYSWKRANIHDCTFVDTGMRWQKGQPGIKGGIVGGGIFAIWIADSEIWNNRFLRTKTLPHEHCYGIKGRQGKRLKIHHNTIEVNFSIEFPFENDEDVEIAHNVLHGTVSIPKHAGGPVPTSGRTFHIHHNLFKDTYSIEFVRNGVEIDHNLFDFNPAKDHGNLISGFGKAPAKGPASFHHNLVNNPGRGVIWINEPYSNLEVRNNHIITRTTKTPRTEGLFGLNAQSDLASLSIRNNIIECIGQARPLMRFKEATAVRVENNRFTNVSDQSLYPNPPTNQTQGLETPLSFTCGVQDEMTVNGWKVMPTNAK
ncbi:MAG: right-handed parallel beta-helix repeat-containing protein, partial [Chthoniobacteraceae bacterium]